jgi:hypothetical protein
VAGVERTPAIGAGVSRRAPDAGLGDSQQQDGAWLAVQQEPAALLADLTVQDDASPATDSIPTIATRATQEFRR